MGFCLSTRLFAKGALNVQAVARTTNVGIPSHHSHTTFETVHKKLSQVTEEAVWSLDGLNGAASLQCGHFWDGVVSTWSLMSCPL